MVPRARDNETSLGQSGMMGVRSVPSLTVWVLQPQRPTTQLPAGNAGLLLWITLQKKQKQPQETEEEISICSHMSDPVADGLLAQQSKDRLRFFGNFVHWVICSACLSTLGQIECLSTRAKNISIVHFCFLWIKRFRNWQQVRDWFCFGEHWAWTYIMAEKRHLCVCVCLCLFLTLPLEFQSSRRLLSCEPYWMAWRDKNVFFLLFVHDFVVLKRVFTKFFCQTHDPIHLMYGSTLRNTASKSTSETKSE